MQIRTSVFRDKLIEAGWLAAAIVVPLFFNPYSHTVFDPDKAALLQAIVLVMGAAWLVRGLEALPWPPGILTLRPRALLTSAWRSPRLPALLLALVALTATVASVAPRISRWGAYERGQGVYTRLAAIALFLLVTSSLRSRRQVGRLVTALLLTSLPIALYGILQRYRLDPVIWTSFTSGRVASTLGNPIPLGGYLILVIPLTATRLAESLEALRRSNQRRFPRALRPVGYLVLLTVQGLAFFLTRSRGPLLGLLTAGFLFGLLWAAVQGRRRWALATTLAALILSLLLLWLAVTPDSFPVPALQRVPGLDRLAGGLDSPEFRSRRAVWEGIMRMSTANPWRLLIGYGPGTLELAFQPYDTQELQRLTFTGGQAHLPAEAHNIFLNLLSTTGLAGLGAYLLLVTFLCQRGLQGLGLIPDPDRRRLFLLCWSGGGVAGAVAPSLLGGTASYLAVGLAPGLVSGIILYLILVSGNPDKASSADRPFLVVGLLAAVVGHLVELQFGLLLTAARTLFWIYAALLLVLQGGEEEDLATSKGAETGSQGWIAGALVALILTTFAYGVITPRFAFNSQGLGVFGVLAATWVLAGFLFWAEGPFSLGRYSLASLGGLALFLFPHQAILRQQDTTPVIAVYFGYLLLVLGALAMALTLTEPRPERGKRGMHGWAYPFLALAIVALIAAVVRPVWADVYVQNGLGLHAGGSYSRAIHMYRRALALVPDQDIYYLYLAESAKARMEEAPDSQERLDRFRETLQALERALALNPLRAAHAANLAQIYQMAGGFSKDPAQRARWLEKAHALFQQAVERNPRVYGPKLQAEIQQTELALGVAYSRMGRWPAAVEALKRAAERDPADYQSRKYLAEVYGQLGLVDAALAEAEQALALAPEEEKAELEALVSQLEAQ